MQPSSVSASAERTPMSALDNLPESRVSESESRKEKRKVVRKSRKEGKKEGRKESKQSKAKQSKAKQSKAKQSKAKQSKAIFLLPRRAANFKSNFPRIVMNSSHARCPKRYSNKMKRIANY